MKHRDPDDIITPGGSIFFPKIVEVNHYGHGKYSNLYTASTYNDNFYGGYGSDTVGYNDANAGITVNLTANRLGYSIGEGAASGDRFYSIENIIGTQYDDAITGGNQANTFYGRDGDDVLRGNGGNDHLEGGRGQDFLIGGSGSDVLYGGFGADTLQGDTGDDELHGGSGNDRLAGGAGQDKLYGDNGADSIYGGAENDLIYGGNSDDRLYGDEGNDYLFGGVGDDTLEGGDGDDILIGGNLDVFGDGEYFSVDYGNDWLVGGAGDDSFVGGYGADVINGGSGSDSIVFFGDEGVTVNLTTGLGSGGEAQGDTYYKIEHVYGTEHADEITGNKDDNTLVGQGGNDVLYGAEGNDGLIGGDGDDDLFGGLGNDEMMGGLGIDTFVFENNDSRFNGVEHGNDVITDFEVGIDKIDLSDTEVRNFNSIDDSDGDYFMADDGNGGTIIYTLAGVEGDSITLEGVAYGTLSAGDFLF